MPKLKRRIRVIYKRLQKAFGYCCKDHIELDTRLKGKKHLEILTHECLHYLQPDWTEEAVEKYSIIITNTLWAEGYRRIDNNNETPLQDGSK